MGNKSFRFTAAQTGILIFTVFIAILFFLNAAPYRDERTDNLSPAWFQFLQKGSYVLTVSYENSPSGNVVFIFSNDMVDESNQPGIIYTVKEISEGSGEVLVPLELEQAAFNVCVSAALDGDQGGCLTKVAIESNQIIFRDHYFLCAVTLIVGAILAFLFRKLPPEKYRLPLVLAAMGVLATIPLFSDFIFSGSEGDDIYFHLTRLEGIYRGLASGDFPVRITPEQMSGYGGVTAIMYPQLFLYPAAMLRFLGVSLMLCYKVLILAINVATAFAGYYAAKNVCGSRRVAMWMSVFYTFSAYRLGNLYVRGALGEALAMVFLPLVIWGAYEVLWGNRRWIVLALAMTGVLESHVLSVEMCALFMALEFVFWLFYKKKDLFWPRVLDGAKAVAVTLLFNATFLVPFLYFCGEDLQCFHLPAEISEHAAYFSQMFSLFPPVTGASQALGSTQGEMPITIGGVLLLGSVLFLAGRQDGEGKGRWEGIGIHCLMLGSLAVLIASWIFPWNKIEGMEILGGICSSLQFPWRFLGPASVFLSLTSAIAIAELTEGKSKYGWIQAAMAMLTLATAGYMFDGLSQRHVQSDEKMLLERADLCDGMYAYFDGVSFRPVQLDYGRNEAYIKTANGTQVEYADFRRNGSHIYVVAEPLEEKEDYFMFPLYWFPGYEITVNGEKAQAYMLSTLVACRVPEERAVIEVRYVGFWFFTAADIVTLLAFAGILGRGLYKRIPGMRKRPRILRNREEGAA